jgi:hypothetical protein
MAKKPKLRGTRNTIKKAVIFSITAFIGGMLQHQVVTFVII